MHTFIPKTNEYGGLLLVNLLTSKLDSVFVNSRDTERMEGCNATGYRARQYLDVIRAIECSREVTNKFGNTKTQRIEGQLTEVKLCS